MQKIGLILLLVVGTGVLKAQSDTTRVVRKTNQYTMSEDYTEIVPIVMDTLISGFQTYKVVDKHTPFYSSLGNYGLPVEEQDFFKRSTDSDQFIYRHYKPYMHHLQNKIFIDTQVPFSEMIFTFGGGRSEAEQTLQFRHSQNVNPFLNFGIDLDVVNSLGQYSYQATDDKSMTLHTSYLGKKYELFGAWTLNSFSGQENGGLADESQIETLATRDLPTNLGGLNNAETVFKYKDFLLVQRFTIGGGSDVITDSLSQKKASSLKGTFSHILSWESGKKTFSDDYPTGEFFDTTFVTGPENSNATFDSLYSRVLRNTLRFDFTVGEGRAVQLDIGVGISNELTVYSQIRPTHGLLQSPLPEDGDATYNQYIRDLANILGKSFNTIPFSTIPRWENSSNAILGRISNRIGEGFGWDAAGKLYFTGEKAGDINLNGTIYSHFGSGKWASEIYGTGSFLNQGPSFWQNSWGSEHFVWANDFTKELRINIGGGYRIPNFKLDLSADYTLITNYLYFNTSVNPAQYDGSISVLALRFNKNFSFWKFRFDNRVLVQKSSHPDIISLPLAAVKSSFYFDHLFYFKITDGRLGFQIGAEVLYNTPYFSSAYMPSTGSYYNQSQIETGSYPYVSAFVNLKIKRTRIFVAFDHINHGINGMGYGYNTVPSYKMPVRMFKYGISWTFYN